MLPFGAIATLRGWKGHQRPRTIRTRSLSIATPKIERASAISRSVSPLFSAIHGRHVRGAEQAGGRGYRRRGAEAEGEEEGVPALQLRIEPEDHQMLAAWGETDLPPGRKEDAGEGPHPAHS